MFSFSPGPTALFILTIVLGITIETQGKRIIYKLQAVSSPKGTQGLSNSQHRSRRHEVYYTQHYTQSQPQPQPQYQTSHQPQQVTYVVQSPGPQYQMQPQMQASSTQYQPQMQPQMQASSTQYQPQMQHQVQAPPPAQQVVVVHQTPPPEPVPKKSVSMNCQCGAVQGSGTKQYRIVGGQEAQPNSRPWMAALVTRRNFQFCGGTIISNRYVMTAAHCVHGQTAKRVYVVVGLHDKLDRRQISAGRKPVSFIDVHPQYDPVTVDNDIALLRLSKPLNFNNNIMPACLPNPGTDFTGANGTVSGWGSLSSSGPSSQTLQEVQLPIWSFEQCLPKFNRGEFTTNMMCAGYQLGGRDACQGDSGGPMVLFTSNRWHVIGVVSWGNGCAEPDKPGVYTKLVNYVTWIYLHTQDAIYCS